MQGKKIRNITIAVLCMVLFIYLTIIIGSAMTGRKVGLFSLKFYIMSSDSADSNISSGDLVVGKNIKTEDIKAGDDIIYKRNNGMIVKKITSVKNNNGNVSLYIENDDVVSGESRQNMQIEGKVLFKISGFGNFALFIQSPMGALNILIIIICVFFLVRKISQVVQNNKIEQATNGEADNEEKIANSIDSKNDNEQNKN